MTLTPFASQVIVVARGVAALLVVADHLTHLTVLGFGGDIATLPAFFMFMGFSHQAVVVFFVLSGFLIGGKIVAAAHDGRDFLGGYLVDRTIRIYMVLLPALALTAACDAIGGLWPATRDFYAATPFLNSHAAEVLAVNLAGLQDSVGVTFGSNCALWSLACEYWYYIAAGFMGAALTRAPASRPVRYGFGAAALAIVALKSAIPGYFLFGFLLWCVGALARAFPLRFAPPMVLAFVMFATAFILAVPLVGRDDIISGNIHPTADGLVAITFAILLAAANARPGSAPRLLEAPVFGFLSDISYSLYAVHMPLLMLALAMTRTIAPVLMAPVGLLVALAGATFFYRAFESRTDMLRRYVHRFAPLARAG